MPTSFRPIGRFAKTPRSTFSTSVAMVASSIPNVSIAIPSSNACTFQAIFTTMVTIACLLRAVTKSAQQIRMVLQHSIWQARCMVVHAISTIGETTNLATLNYRDLAKALLTLCALDDPLINIMPLPCWRTAIALSLFPWPPSIHYSHFSQMALEPKQLQNKTSVCLRFTRLTFNSNIGFGVCGCFC